jgi:uncharacterized protein YbjT (DUF2867 family)
VLALTHRPSAAESPAAVEFFVADLAAPESLDAAQQRAGAVFSYTAVSHLLSWIRDKP